MFNQVFGMVFGNSSADEEDKTTLISSEPLQILTSDEIMTTANNEQPRKKRGRPPKNPNSVPNASNSAQKTPSTGYKKKYKKNKYDHSDDYDENEDSDASSYSNQPIVQTTIKHKNSNSSTNNLISAATSHHDTTTTTPRLSRQTSASSTASFSLLRRSSARRSRAIDITRELIVLMPNDDPVTLLNLDPQEALEFQILLENNMESGYYSDVDKDDHGHGGSGHVSSNTSTRVVRELSNYFDGSVPGHSTSVKATNVNEVFTPGVTEVVTTQDVLVKLKASNTTNSGAKSTDIPVPSFATTSVGTKPVKILTATQYANRTADGKFVKSGRGYISKATAEAMQAAALKAESLLTLQNPSHIDISPSLQLLENTPLWPPSDSSAATTATVTTSLNNDTVNTNSDITVMDIDTGGDNALITTTLVDNKDNVVNPIALSDMNVEPAVSTEEHHHDNSAIDNASSSLPTTGRTSSRVRKSVTPFSPCEYDDTNNNHSNSNVSNTTKDSSIDNNTLTAQQQEEQFMASVIRARKASGYYRDCLGNVADFSAGIVPGTTVNGRYISRALAATLIAQKVAASTCTSSVWVNDNIRTTERSYIDYDCDSDDERFVDELAALQSVGITSLPASNDLLTSPSVAVTEETSHTGVPSNNSSSNSRVSSRLSTQPQPIYYAPTTSVATATSTSPAKVTPVVSLRLFEIFMSHLERELELTKKVLKGQGGVGVALGQGGFELLALHAQTKLLVGHPVEDAVRNVNKYLVAYGATTKPLTSTNSASCVGSQNQNQKKSSPTTSNSRKKSVKYLRRLIATYENEINSGSGLVSHKLKSMQHLPSPAMRSRTSSTSNLLLDRFKNNSSTALSSSTHDLQNVSSTTPSASNQVATTELSRTATQQTEIDNSSKTSSIVCHNSRSRSNSDMDQSDGDDEQPSVSVQESNAEAPVSITLPTCDSKNSQAPTEVQQQNPNTSTMRCNISDTNLFASASNVLNTSYVYLSDDESASPSRHMLGTGSNAYGVNSSSGKKVYNKTKKRPLSGAAAVATAKALARIEAANALFKQQNPNYDESQLLVLNCQKKSHSRGGGRGKKKKKDKKEKDTNRLDLTEYPIYTVQQLQLLVPEAHAMDMLQQVYSAYLKSVALDAAAAIAESNGLVNTAAPTTPIGTPASVSNKTASHGNSHHKKAHIPASQTVVTKHSYPHLIPYFLRVYNYWLDKRSKCQTSFLRCYHNYMMELWKQQESLAVPVVGDFTLSTMRHSLSRLTTIRADLERYRVLMDRVKRREKLKQQLLRCSGEAMDAQLKEFLESKVENEQKHVAVLLEDTANPLSTNNTARISNRVKTPSAKNATSSSAVVGSSPVPATRHASGIQYDPFQIVLDTAAMDSDCTVYSDTDSSDDDSVHSDISCSDAETAFQFHKKADVVSPMEKHLTTLNNVAASAVTTPAATTATAGGGDVCSISSSVFASTCSGKEKPHLVDVSDNRITTNNLSIKQALSLPEVTSEVVNDVEGEEDDVASCISAEDNANEIYGDVAIDNVDTVHDDGESRQILSLSLSPPRSGSNSTGSSKNNHSVRSNFSSNSLYWDPNVTVSPAHKDVVIGMVSTQFPCESTEKNVDSDYVNGDAEPETATESTDPLQPVKKKRGRKPLDPNAMRPPQKLKPKSPDAANERSKSARIGSGNYHHSAIKAAVIEKVVIPVVPTKATTDNTPSRRVSRTVSAGSSDNLASPPVTAATATVPVSVSPPVAATTAEGDDSTVKKRRGRGPNKIKPSPLHAVDVSAATGVSANTVASAVSEGMSSESLGNAVSSPVASTSVSTNLFSPSPVATTASSVNSEMTSVTKGVRGRKRKTPSNDTEESQLASQPLEVVVNDAAAHSAEERQQSPKRQKKETVDLKSTDSIVAEDVVMDVVQEETKMDVADEKEKLLEDVTTVSGISSHKNDGNSIAFSKTPLIKIIYLPPTTTSTTSTALVIAKPSVEVPTSVAAVLSTMSPPAVVVKKSDSSANKVAVVVSSVVPASVSAALKSVPVYVAPTDSSKTSNKEKSEQVVTASVATKSHRTDRTDVLDTTQHHVSSTHVHKTHSSSGNNVSRSSVLSSIPVVDNNSKHHISPDGSSSRNSASVPFNKYMPPPHFSSTGSVGSVSSNHSGGNYGTSSNHSHRSLHNSFSVHRSEKPTPYNNFGAAIPLVNVRTDTVGSTNISRRDSDTHSRSTSQQRLADSSRSERDRVSDAHRLADADRHRGESKPDDRRTSKSPPRRTSKSPPRRTSKSPPRARDTVRVNERDSSRLASPVGVHSRVSHESSRLSIGSSSRLSSGSRLVPVSDCPLHNLGALPNSASKFSTKDTSTRDKELPRKDFSSISQTKSTVNKGRDGQESVLNRSEKSRDALKTDRVKEAERLNRDREEKDAREREALRIRNEKSIKDREEEKTNKQREAHLRADMDRKEAQLAKEKEDRLKLQREENAKKKEQSASQSRNQTVSSGVRERSRDRGERVQDKPRESRVGRDVIRPIVRDNLLREVPTSRALDRDRDRRSRDGSKDRSRETTRRDSYSSRESSSRETSAVRGERERDQQKPRDNSNSSREIVGSNRDQQRDRNRGGSVVDSREPVIDRRGNNSNNNNNNNNIKNNKNNGHNRGGQQDRNNRK